MHGRRFAARDVLNIARAGGARVHRRGLDFVRLTIPQRTFLADERPVVLWRDGNQLGKSWALALDIVCRCRGKHPLQAVRRPPINVLVIGVSFEQMAPLMHKIWEVAPRNELDPKCAYDPGRGITGKPPRLVFASGPGKGSVISFATYGQGSKRVAGGTLHVVVMDEPPPEGMFGEVVPRVLKQRGIIRIGMTPTPEMPPQGWLRDKVDAGTVHEHNFGLSAVNCHPEGYPAPWLSQHEIDEYEGMLLPIEREMRMRGSWDPVVLGRMLDAFNEHTHVIDERPPAGAFLIVGNDHGVQANKQTAVLAAVEDRLTSRPRAFVIDETPEGGISTPEQDARAILTMLKRRGLRYDDVDAWVGDRPTASKSRLRAIRKSNKDLQVELAALLGRKVDEVQKIKAVKKWHGSFSYGMRLLNTMAARHRTDGPDLRVHPRCKRFIEACNVFDGNPHHPLKDVLDGGRYAIETAVSSKAAVSLVARY